HRSGDVEVAGGREVHARDGDGGRRVFVEVDGQLVAAQQVDAVEARVGREPVDLLEQGVELRGQRGAHVGVGGLLRLADERLGGLHQLRDRGDAVAGGLDRVDAVRHRVEQVAQVAGAVRQALSGEEVDRVVERGV